MDGYYTGPEFYDQDDVFDIYQSRRGSLDNPNDTIEKPIFLEMVGEVSGLNILDLGCGDASIGREMMMRGAKSYLGVDGSQNMIAKAQEAITGTGGEVKRADLESWKPPEGAFQLVVSRLVFQYIVQLDRLLQSVFRSLSEDGRLVFSVEHPVITSSNRSYPPGTIRQDWIVDDYFNTGRRTPLWLGQKVMKIHRTVEDYYVALQQAGFQVESLRESRPRRELFASEETFQRRLRIPLFLFLSARRRSS
jgi:trans-aconitate methyltransferase